LNSIILAKELHIDIDEVKSWPLEKQLKWIIALNLIAERIKQQMPKIEPLQMAKPKKGRSFVRVGDKIVMV